MKTKQPKKRTALRGSTKTGYVEYRSNNSGGSWWLKDKDWKALEKAGWEVKWIANDPFYKKWGGTEDGRWLGGLAKEATLRGVKLPEAVESFERATGACATDVGCPCCGNPHNFTEYDAAGKYLASGPETSYSASF